MSDLKDQEQASYTVEPAAVDISVIIETYTALLTGDNLPERIAVQTVDLRELLNNIETIKTASEVYTSKSKRRYKKLLRRCSQLNNALIKARNTKPVDVAAAREIGLLNEAKELSFTAIKRMRAAHVPCLDLTLQAETLVGNISAAIHALSPAEPAQAEQYSAADELRDLQQSILQSKTLSDFNTVKKTVERLAAPTSTTEGGEA